MRGFSGEKGQQNLHSVFWKWYREENRRTQGSRRMNQGVSCSVLSSEKLTLQLEINQWLQYATAHKVKAYSKLQYTFPHLVLEAKFKIPGRILLRHWSHRIDYILYVHIRLRQVLKEHFLVPHFSIPPISLLILFFISFVWCRFRLPGDRNQYLKLVLMNRGQWTDTMCTAEQGENTLPYHTLSHPQQRPTSTPV